MQENHTEWSTQKAVISANKSCCTEHPGVLFRQQELACAITYLQIMFQTGHAADNPHTSSALTICDVLADDCGQNMLYLDNKDFDSSRALCSLSHHLHSVAVAFLHLHDHHITSSTPA